ncbi:MAG: transposase [Acidobacteria bacterium]|nr:transposase [Acidobacteriota bacterium]
MRVGVKFKTNPTSAQKLIFARWAGCARNIYNAKVEEDTYYRSFRRNSLALTGYPLPNDTAYSHLRSEEMPWLDEVPSQILRNSVVNWRDGLERYNKGLASLPTKKKKSNRTSVTLTRELFEFVPQSDGTHQLVIGTKRFPFGVLSFHAHRKYGIPNTIILSRHNADYFVSFNYEVEKVEVVADADLLAHLQTFTVAELLAQTEGHDRGVAIAVQSSDGTAYDFTPEQKRHIERIQVHIKELQKKLARQIKGSVRHTRTKRQISKLHATLANIRLDFAHQTSHRITNKKVLLHVFEALLVANMTAAPAPKQDETGKFIPNGAAAKAGLNKAILMVAWGMILQFTTYKAARRGALVVAVPAHHSSQECAHCGYTHPNNRVSQSQFVCGRCGHVANADENASTVIKQRGVVLVLSQLLQIKTKKKTGSKLRVRATEAVTNTPAGTRGSARREESQTGTTKALFPAASLKREASKTSEPTAAGWPAENVGVRGSLADYQLDLFSL